MASFDVKFDIDKPCCLGFNMCGDLDVEFEPFFNPESAGTYASLPDKPTITEQDLGIIGSGDDRTFGPIGTSTTVTIEGDKSQAGYQDLPFTTTEIDVIIAMAERAGAI